MFGEHKITPCLWFDDNAEEAMNFYVSIFDNSKVLDIARYGEADSVMVCAFELAGQRFTALNGGPMFKFNEAISLQVSCESQEEVDALWEKLTADGGEPSECGWLKDKYRLSWQIVPSRLIELMSDEDAVKANRVMQAMLQMSKIDIAALERAYRGE